MLLVKLTIGEDDYAIESSCIKEIIPLVKLKTIPYCEKYILGAINYHGASVPVVDINILCNRSETQNILTTRIIIVKYNEQDILGIKAENVTETVQIDNNALNSQEISTSNHVLLGPVFKIGNTLIQIIQSNKILAKDVQDMLFNRSANSTQSGGML